MDEQARDAGLQGPSRILLSCGDNFGETFRVEEGVLRVVYDAYETFDGKFGHLFYKDKFSHYILRVEYRFVGQQASGGPGWARRYRRLCGPPRCGRCPCPRNRRRRETAVPPGSSGTWY